MKTEKKENKLQIEEYHNAVILPRVEVENGPRWGLGGVCSQDNQFVYTSFYDGGWATHGGAYVWKEEQYIDESVVYVGMFFQHWGHFLIDLTNRMWALPELNQKCLDIKVAYIGEEEPGKNHFRFFELLGIKREQLFHVKRPTRFRKVYLPEQGFKSCEWYSEEFLQMLNFMIQQSKLSGADVSRIENLKKVYFTRRKFPKACSSEFGEEFFENIFSSNGFISVAPEMLSLDEQIYIWNHAEQIVCMNGTIPLNVMFAANSKLQLTIFNKTSIYHENPMILLRMRKIEAKFVDIYKEPMKEYPKSLGEGPYLLSNTKNFQKYCQYMKVKIPIKRWKEYMYFKINEWKYFWAIIGLKRKIRMIISKVIPKRCKKIIYNFRKG